MPDPTPFGDRFLPRPLLELVTTRKSTDPAPIFFQAPIPNDPALVGLPFSFQALSRTSTSPTGASWTLAKTVTVTP